MEWKYDSVVPNIMDSNTVQVFSVNLNNQGVCIVKYMQLYKIEVIDILKWKLYFTKLHMQNV